MENLRGRDGSRDTRNDIYRLKLAIEKLIATTQAGSDYTALLTSIDNSLNNMELDVDNIDLSNTQIEMNTDDLETLITATNTELLKYGKHRPMSGAGAFETISVGASVETLTIPVGAVGAVISVDTNSIRIRYDAAPTISVGHKSEEGDLIYLGELDDITALELTNFKAIAATATASTIFIQYYEKAP